MKRLLFLVFFVFFSSSLLAESEHPWWRVWETVDESTGVSERLFTSEEKKVLRDYLRSQKLSEEDNSVHDYKHKDRKHKKDKGHNGNKKKSLPPGLQKKVDRGGQLPPGWQTKVARGEVLDGDLYEVSDDLPPGISRQIENIEGTSVRQVEDRVVRILDSTGEILDVLLGR
ncbi:MAG: hypothetical protein KJO69_00405 [Gammaproteobacteria bacterium]|nr:hypothetical protein [Gammaproteobacteria bacterium]